jgi:hypothetical protein
VGVNNYNNLLKKFWQTNTQNLHSEFLSCSVSNRKTQS